MPAGVAARVAGWQRRYGGSWAVPSASSGAEQQPVRVELFLGGAWVDITRVSADQPGVFYEDAITISRGRPDEASTADYARCTFTLNNAGGWFSPRNPLSPYYGLIGRNTPIRVSVLRRGVRRYRFYGEVSSWPQRWDPTGRHVWVPVEAAGIVRRLTQGSSPLRSTLYRGLTSKKVKNLRAYWPCEDQDGSTSLASALGGKPMRIVGTPSLASFSDFGASDAIPSLNDSEWTGVVPSYPAASAIQLRFLLAVPATAAANDQSVIKLFTSGSAQIWHLVYKAVGDLTLEAYSGNDLDTLIGTSSDIVFGVNGKLLRVSVQLQQDGSNVDWTVATLEPGRSSGLTASGTLSNRTIKQAKQIVVNNGGGLADVAVGHISVQSSISSIFDLGTELAAYKGERAWTRVRRLCSENDLEFHMPDDTRTGITTSSARMGEQLPKSLIDLLRECADTDGGILREEREMLGLGYRTITTLYNQDPKVALDYSAAHLVPSLEPVDDDQATRNDVTTTRERGSSARITIDEGPLSTLPPPDGVGTYDEAVTFSAAFDEQLSDLASWRAHLGTVDEARYPVINVHLDRQQITGDVDLENSLLTVDLGDRLTIDNPPPWLPPEQISQLVQGYTETITGLEHTIAFNCSPASPYGVGVWDSTRNPYGNPDGDRYGTAGSELAAAATADAGTLSVATTTGPLWTTDPVDLPIDLMVGGERVRVEAASSRVTDTFTRSESSGWGSAGSGQAWSTSGGAASDYSVDGSAGLVSAGTVAVRRFTSISSGLGDVAMLARVTVPVLAATSSISGGLVARYADDSNFYLVQLLHDTGGMIDVEIVKRVAGTFTTIVSRSNHMAYTPGTPTWVRFAVAGTLLRANIWAGDLDDEPAGWVVQGTDASFSSGAVGTHTNLLTGNTNSSPVVVSYDDLVVEVGAVSGASSPQTMTVTRAVNGIAKPHTAGTAVRLFTPTYRAL